MAHKWVRVALNSAIFPFESDLEGRTIIVPGSDTNFDFISQMNEPTKDRGLPQAYYMHNCLPTGGGYQAVGYDTFIGGLGTAVANDFDRVFPLEYTSPQVAKFLFSPAAGKNYVFDANVGVWASLVAMGTALSSVRGQVQQQFSATASTYVDESNPAVPGSVVSSLGCYLTGGSAISGINLYIVQQVAAGQYTVVASNTGVTHNGNGWQDFSLAATYTIPGTGNYYVAIYIPASATFNYTSPVSSASIAGPISGVTTGWTEAGAGGTVPSVRASVGTTLVGQIPQNTFVTTAYVAGNHYIYYQNVGCFMYNSTNRQLDAVSLGGLQNSNVKGVCSANGYLITWNDTTIAWSNFSDPEDFVPSLVTGAGGGAVNYINGKIQFCLPISGGFMLYCERNAVSATYTSNVRYPYVFQEVANSGGCSSPDLVSWQDNMPSHYAWTTAGVQELGRTTATDLFPEATDWLGGLVFEDFDEISLMMSQVYLTSPLNLKVSAVANRYVIISYGIAYPDFTHALVYDIALKRWGKLKITHRACFEWNAPNLWGPVVYGGLVNTTYGMLSGTAIGDLATKGVNVPESAKKNISFLLSDGTVKTVNFDLSQTKADGVLMLGKFQFERNKFLCHQRCDVENIVKGNAFQLYIVPTLDGKTLLTPVPAVLLSQGQNVMKYGKRITGANISLLLVGAFNVVSVLLDFTLGGDR